MGKITDYSTVTTLNEAMFFILAIDTDADGDFESRKTSLATLRSVLYATGSLRFNLSKGADIASATALPIGSDGNYFDITGTTTITSFTNQIDGVQIILRFDASLTLTHDNTNLVLPGGENIVTEAGDHAAFVQYQVGDWRLLWYARESLIPIKSGFLSPVYIDAAPQALSGPGAVDIVSPVTNVTTTGGTDALTLINSTVLGQIKVINHSVDGGGYILTPTTLSGGVTITVTDLSVSITLMWTASGWRLVSQTGVATIA